MLQNLHVKNLALITETEVEFKEGLNILTGETGAGKSIIIGSVALALGEKVPKELLRDNEETALVELVFSVENPKVLDAIRQLGIETEDETVILSRKITSGRAIARINGEAVSASRIAESTDNGIASFSAQEKSTISTETAFVTFLVNSHTSPVPRKVYGTSLSAKCSAFPSSEDFSFSDSSIIAMIFSYLLDPFTSLTRIVISPSSTTVPAYTTPSGTLRTGTDSPVKDA
jgi:DNA repair protein RecN (Recombination protein N)